MPDLTVHRCDLHAASDRALFDEIAQEFGETTTLHLQWDALGALMAFSHPKLKDNFWLLMDAKQLPWVHLGKEDLRGVSLAGASLGKLDFSACRLHRVDMSKCFLGKANLSYTVVRGASFRSAFLRGANLAGASFIHTDFTGADLRDACTKDTYFIGCTLTSAHF